ncbi:LCP family protein [Curtanaerobium respiraculi]|uniref:LCP family protein n=1 Tax=Curtanaerobium respiraculi TaxID=2949669 RepID=UPI0024B39FD3|nr:LCP family protein [Curtanaerobium respiraculi]
MARTYGKHAKHASGKPASNGGYAPNSPSESRRVRSQPSPAAQPSAGSSRVPGARQPYDYQRNYQAQQRRQQSHYRPAAPSCPQSETGMYSRGNYGNGREVLIPARKRRRRKLTIVLAVIIALLLLVGTAAGLYLHQLGSNMGLDQSDSSAVQAALTEPRANEPYYVLLVGNDSREGTTSEYEASMSHGQRSDVMVLVRIDAANKQVTMLSIPRDTPYKKADGTYEKLNNSYSEGGASATIKAVESVTGAKIAHYAEIDYEGFETLVDSLGGIEVDIPVDFTYSNALTGEVYDFKAGKQVLNGAEAQVVARERLVYGIDQDKTRQDMVRQIIKAIMKAAQKQPVTQLPQVALDIANCVKTDFTSTEAIALAQALSGGVTVYSGTGPYAGAVNPAVGGLWLCYQDPDGWARVMETVNAGGDPSTVSYIGDVVTIAGTGETLTITQ